MANEQGSVTFVVKQGNENEADAPSVQSGEVLQYATSQGLVFRQYGGDVWYCDKPQVVYLATQEDPLPFDADRELTNSINLPNTIGAPGGTIYYCDVDIYGYDDGSTATTPLGFDLYAEVDGPIVSGTHYTVAILKNRSFRVTVRIKFEASPGDSFRLFATVPDADFDAIFVAGGTCEIRRAYYLD
jgi:hypothetical protein